MSGAELIAAERQRQIDQEGYDAAHDDVHAAGELLLAANCYMEEISVDAPAPESWPFEPLAWKPSSDEVRMLTKAGALILAERDRLQRRAGEMCDGGLRRAIDVCERCAENCANAIDVTLRLRQRKAEQEKATP